MPAMQSPKRNSPVSQFSRIWQRISHSEAYLPVSFAANNQIEKNPQQPKLQHMTRPARRTRREILCEHTRSLRLAVDVDLSLIARTSLGLREPDLARLCQLAAQHASNRQDDLVRMADFSDAIDKIFLERRERQ